ncbi:Glycerol-3-phosphate dehydrogenase [NAD(+)] [Fasciola hepatica]|uniref:glycerol-3-phosphate dehydrogenase (NAD(+)) n=1 Tax=Fasciola hepatica TaxID=6192 RepID=A0A4E0RA88_FASHE|nr:Glycerol-3-phosphate dehydrogenase [NAD(+)] [Fasciola hepatica]
MWVYEEEVDGKKLTAIINDQHENVRYLPGIKLPTNVVATPDLCYAAQDADVLIFVMPHQFLQRACTQIKSVLKPGAYGVSLIKTSYFRMTIIKDEVGAELCGALKNIVAVGAGIIEGLGFGDNTKAAVIRLGFMEMKSFIYQFFGDRDPQEGTFLESCGVADLITTCYGGRNKRMGIALATSNKSLQELEKEQLDGQSAQGPLTASEVYVMLERLKLLDRYPLFTAVHRICTRELPATGFVKCLEDHPSHM